MTVTPKAPRLYGIKNSNRTAGALWGKNQFNSAFPAALACYMRDKNISANYLVLTDTLEIAVEDLPFGQLFNSDLPNADLRFDFETKFQPYQQYSLNTLDGIDLVVRHEGDQSSGGWRRALEVKLTVTPDSTTCDLAESEWSPELVIRPATTKYCALGIYHSCKSRKDEIQDIFRDICGNFLLWESPHELSEKRSQLLRALNTFQATFRYAQQPFLLQPIWKTKGQTPFLADKAFDIFVWSDFALCRTFIAALQKSGKIDRATRAAARFARMLYILATEEQANFDKIYTEMSYKLQNDKEFALSGRETSMFLNTPRRAQPTLPKEVITEIVLDGGEKYLKPERRLDATVLFTSIEMFGLEAVEEALEISSENSDSTSTN